MTESDHHAVYAWVAPDWLPSDAPRTLPAIRLWGDVILELVAETERRRLQPPVAIRRTAVFAWPGPLPPQSVLGDTIGKRRVRLLVASDQCAAARVALVNDLYSPTGWRRLSEWLVDRGHDSDFVNEDVVVFTDPTASMFIETARSAVESTSPPLLDDIVTYFRPAASSYLNSWDRLSHAPNLHELEVVVPAHGIIEIAE